MASERRRTMFMEQDAAVMKQTREAEAKLNTFNQQAERLKSRVPKVHRRLLSLHGINFKRNS
jgi:hypothetical protein